MDVLTAGGTPDGKSLQVRLAEQARDVLAAMRELYPRGQAVVAGGFLRDLALGREPKDMDVFLMGDTDERGGLSLDAYEAVNRAIGSITWMSHGGDYGPLVTFGDIVRLGEARKKPDGTDYEVPVNVIVLSRGRLPKDDARLHDFGICQVWYDGFKLHATEAFFRDIEAKSFTLSVCESQREFNRSMRRWARFGPRFPEFHLVVPSQFVKYIDKENPPCTSYASSSSPAP